MKQWFPGYTSSTNTLSLYTRFSPSSFQILMNRRKTETKYHSVSLLNILKTAREKSTYPAQRQRGKSVRIVELMQAPCVSLQDVQLSALQISDSSSFCWLAVCSPLFHSFSGETFHLACHFPCPSTSPLFLLTCFPSFVPLICGTTATQFTHSALSHGVPKICTLLLNPFTKDWICLRAFRAPHTAQASSCCDSTSVPQNRAVQAHSNIWTSLQTAKRAPSSIQTPETQLLQRASLAAMLRTKFSSKFQNQLAIFHFCCDK